MDKSGFFKIKQESGFYKLPKEQTCTHPEHSFPMHIYIPRGQGYRHVCPGCGKVQVAHNHGVSM